MRKMIIFFCLIIFCFAHGRACDICGCGSGNSYMGILPDFNKTIFGIRYRYNSLSNHIAQNGVATYLTANETYRTAEFWSGWNINTKWRIMGSVPYGFNERTKHGLTDAKSGIGDISFSGYYQAINNRKTVLENKLLVQSLWIGGGVKLPAGRYNPSDKTGGNNNTNLFQLGTGSTDFSVNAMYDIRLQDAGLNFSSGYKANTRNKYNYKYGNKLSATAQAYYKFRIKNIITLAPNAGVQFERANKDTDRKFSADVTGGDLLLSTAGLEINYKKMSAGGNWQRPMHQNLGNGFVKASGRIMAHVSFRL